MIDLRENLMVFWDEEKIFIHLHEFQTKISIIYTISAIDLIFFSFFSNRNRNFTCLKNENTGVLHPHIIIHVDYRVRVDAKSDRILQARTLSSIRNGNKFLINQIPKHVSIT